MSENGQAQEMVTLTIDDQEVTVPKGTNLIEAAKQAQSEVPYYCYHPHLSVPGNCRMCQVEVEGAPKLMIGCHTQVQDGMVVRTHRSSETVKQAQASTLELLLINHPLDCTVCDQAGHCKLQDYHFEYNAKPSRFLEEKNHKVKAEPLGPTVILDGERCISCTRCVRFCEEVTGTGELGLLNRGDKNVIAVHPDKELNNPLSGSVVDLCPVGALTHRNWRFNTRMWFTDTTESICPGCSTGCNVRVYERDGKVVNVKARLNGEVNKEWMCDEGRYGFDRFIPESRLTSPTLKGEEASWDDAVAAAKGLTSGKTLVLLAPDLHLEEFAIAQAFVQQVLSDADVVLAYRERTLTEVEAVLISPDYAANFRGAEFVGLVSGDLEQQYTQALEQLQKGAYENVLVVGDRALCVEDQDQSAFTLAMTQASCSVGILSDARSKLAQACAVTLPSRPFLEKSGMLINRTKRLQYARKVIEPGQGSEPSWKILGRIAQAAGQSIVEARTDRDVTLSLLGAEPRLKGLRIAKISREGICLDSYTPEESPADENASGDARA